MKLIAHDRPLGLRIRQPARSAQGGVAAHEARSAEGESLRPRCDLSRLVFFPQCRRTLDANSRRTILIWNSRDREPPGRTSTRLGMHGVWLNTPPAILSTIADGHRRTGLNRWRRLLLLTARRDIETCAVAMQSDNISVLSEMLIAEH
jgi:hypothetical protein